MSIDESVEHTTRNGVNHNRIIILGSRYNHRRHSFSTAAAAVTPKRTSHGRKRHDRTLQGSATTALCRGFTCDAAHDAGCQEKLSLLPPPSDTATKGLYYTHPVP